MSREENKAKYEKNIFLTFLKASNLSINENTIRSGKHNQKEPDLLCEFKNGEHVAFELGRIRDPILSAAVNSWSPVNGEYIRTKDPTETIVIKKLKKKYEVLSPIELLLYKEAPIITPNDVLIPTIKSLCTSINHNYNRIWFMSNEIELLYGSN